MKILTLLVAVYLALLNLVKAATLFNGAQAVVFPNTTSTACLAAFNTTLSCDQTLVQFLPRIPQYAQWNTTSRNALCTSSCGTSLQSLQSAVNSACSGQKFNWTSTTMSFTQVVQMYNYKFNLICLKDNVTGGYCSDTEATWNISQMDNAGKATWPSNTVKLYPDPNMDWLENINADNTTNIFTIRNATAGSQIDGLLAPATEDYLYSRKGPSNWDDSNYGWPAALEYDEYPLEIQCHNCLINRFLLGISSQFGLRYHEITQQYVKNWQSNCDMTMTFTPAMNITHAARNAIPVLPSGLPVYCFQNLTLASPFNTSTTCQAFALMNSIPVRGLMSLNSYPGSKIINCNGLANGTYCAPPTCPIAVVSTSTDAGTFTSSYTNFTLTQFLSWNPSVRPKGLLKGDTVCVGPSGTVYKPSILYIAPTSTVYLTTATPPAPTSTGTFKGCGQYHTAQSGEVCAQIALNYTITFIQFLAMNPLVNAGCTNLVIGNSYCVGAVNGTKISTPITISPPASTVSGTTKQCYSWHIMKATDTCGLVAAEYGLTMTDFMLFNKGINAGCNNLVVGDAYCIDGTGAHSAGNATTVSAPAPTKAGTIQPCYKWHVAVGGDSCPTIQQQFGITSAMLNLWNPALVTCSTGLVTGNAYCVDGTGKMATVTSAVAPASTISGTTSPCYAWHVVSSGDTCSLLVDAFGVSLGAIEAWNPSMGSSCTLPAVGKPICVDGAGRPSTVTPAPPPGPTLQGTAVNCYAWHVIASGETCSAIQTKYGLYFALFQAWNPTLNNACTNLQLGVAYCVQGTPTPYQTSNSQNPSNFAFWTLLGCYADTTSTRTLRYLQSIPNAAKTMTIESCQAACSSAGYKLAGIEWGQECFCDNVIAANGPAPDGNAQCNVACPGNPSETCGGSLRLDVYSSNIWTPLGCYADTTGTRTLGQYMQTSSQASTMTIEVCQTLCQNAGYLYSGVEWGQECFCDNALHGGPAPEGASGCNMACPGNALETCGASLRLSVSALAAFHPVGCYTDSTGARALNNNMLSGQASKMTIELCQNACRAGGYRLAGLEYANECFCDSSIRNGNAPAPDGNAGCNMPCAGSASEICGGNLRINVFAL